jgi:hypothetical protein
VVAAAGAEETFIKGLAGVVDFFIQKGAQVMQVGLAALIFEGFQCLDDLRSSSRAFSAWTIS